jgi:hypothetical protein
LSALEARQRGAGLTCAICGAPALPLDGTCVFCHAPLDKEDEPFDLLDYLVERIPTAKVRRGHLNRGPISELTVDVGGRTYRARWEKESLEFQPPVMLTAWLDLLLSGLSDAAGADADLRRAVLRSGWALR